MGNSEIVGSSEERPTVNEAAGEFSVFFVSWISNPHSICGSRVSSYVSRPILHSNFLSTPSSIFLYVFRHLGKFNDLNVKVEIPNNILIFRGPK
jgi:hypothetical protein